MGAMTRRAFRPRLSRGISLVELLVTLSIVMISMAALSEMAVLMTRASVTTTNKVDGLAAARFAINRISSDVRQARAVGDSYGTGAERVRFPAVTNPKYGSLFGTAPTAGTNWPPPPWTLSDSVLVLQIPVLYEDPNNPSNLANGMPLMLPMDHFRAGVPPVNMENFDTVVYQIVPDPDRLGEFLLQVARFPGEQIRQVPSKAVAAINPPQTILKGLTGPTTTASGSLPSVFSYLAPQLSSVPFTSVSPSTVNPDAIRGVGVDLQIKNTGLTAQQGDGNYPQFVGIHAESFMRNNIGMPLYNSTVVPP